MNETVRIVLHSFLALNLLLGSSAHASSSITEHDSRCVNKISATANVIERLTNILLPNSRSACSDESYIEAQLQNSDRTYFKSRVFDAGFRESTSLLPRSIQGREIEERLQPYQLESNHSQMRGSTSKPGIPTGAGYQSTGQDGNTTNPSRD